MGLSVQMYVVCMKVCPTDTSLSHPGTMDIDAGQNNRADVMDKHEEWPSEFGTKRVREGVQLQRSCVS